MKYENIRMEYENIRMEYENIQNSNGIWKYL